MELPLYCALVKVGNADTVYALAATAVPPSRLTLSTTLCKAAASDTVGIVNVAVVPLTLTLVGVTVVAVPLLMAWLTTKSLVVRVLVGDALSVTVTVPLIALLPARNIHLSPPL
jgi:hypothetical protein